MKKTLGLLLAVLMLATVTLTSCTSSIGGVITSQPLPGSDPSSQTSSDTESSVIAESSKPTNETTAWVLSGTMKIENYEKSEAFEGSPTIDEGTYNITGVLAPDKTTGKYFVEFKLDDYADEVVLSYWVNKDKDMVDANIGDQDSWILNMYLDSDDNDAMSFEMISRKVTMNPFYYNDGDEACTITISFRYAEAN